jgi:diguanylate cyclase (GGDEF)-like protein
MTETGHRGFAAALRGREFRALWLTEALSVFGDQVARVALALLVYARTDSAALTALTYALTFVPAILGGFLLSGLADRYPRRTVIVVTDVVRAVLAAAMAVPGMPLWILWALIGCLTMAAAPFKAAQLALLPDVLPNGLYQSGLGLRQITTQAAQVAGFGLGGLLVTSFSTSGALLVNAATFLVSAVVVAAVVRTRPVSRAETKSTPRSAAAGSDPRMVAVYMLAAMVGFLVVPEGLAAPYANAVGLTSIGVGVLMAADPVGSVLGGWLASRLRPDTAITAKLVVVPAAASGLPLIACLALPGAWWAAGLWAVSGALSTIYLIRLQAVVVELVSDARRGTTMGRLSTCLYSSQGIAILGAGVVAERLDPVYVVAASGAVASLSAVAAGFVWWAARPRQARTVEDEPAPVDSARSEVLITHSDPLPERPAAGGAEVRQPELEDLGSSPGNGSEISMPNEGVAERSGWSRWAIWLLPRPAAVFLLVIDAIAVVAVAIDAGAPMAWRDVASCGLIVGLGILAAEMTRRVERRRRRFSDTPHVNFSSVWTLAAALTLPTALAALVAVLLYLHLWLRSWRGVAGIHAHRVIFSTANVILSCQIAGWAARQLHVAPPGHEAGAWTAVGLASLIAIYFAANSTIVGVAIALARRSLSFKRLLGALNENILELATLCMGALTAVLLTLRPWLVVVLFLPLYALHRSVLIRQFEHASTTDSKTGLLNAATWHAIAAKEIDRARQHGFDVGVLMIDIDHFRDVNNVHGHLTGDKALVLVGNAIRNEVRSDDLCGRFGGEEFVVLLPGSSPDAIHAIADRIREHVERTVIEPDSGPGFHVSVSIGAAAFPAAGSSLEEVLISADNALFAAKDAGRNQVRVVKSTA